MSALLIVLFATAPLGRASLLQCQAQLVIETLAGRPGTLISDHAADLALPPVGDADLGPAAWASPADLAAWRELAPHLVDGPAAKNAIMGIVRAPYVCPPAVLPLLCEHLRRSFENMREEIASVAIDPHLPPRLGFLMGRVTDRAGLTKARREELLPVAWTFQPTTRTPYLSPGRALAIMRLFAREALIRRLRGAEDLDLYTRLGLATRPALVALMPLLGVKPLRLVLIDGLGGRHGGLWLINQPFRFTRVGETLSFLVRVQLDQPTYRGLQVSVHRTIENPGESAPADFAAYRASLRWLAEDALARFARIAGVTRAPTVRITAEDTSDQPRGGMPRDPALELSVTGLGRLHQILFYYYFAEELAQL